MAFNHPPSQLPVAARLPDGTFSSRRHKPLHFPTTISSKGTDTFVALQRYQRLPDLTPGGNPPQTDILWDRLSLRAREILNKYFVEWWTFEILCLFASFTCMATIIGVLAHYDHKPIPNQLAVRRILKCLRISAFKFGQIGTHLSHRRSSRTAEMELVSRRLEDNDRL